MQCPDCKNGMTAVMYESVEIDRCTVCAGVWLDHGEIQPIVKTEGETFTEHEKIAAIEQKGKDLGQGTVKQCPKCTKTLESMQYAVTSGVIVDRCPDRHGIYFDAGELENVQILMEEYDRRFNPNTEVKKLHIADVKLCPRDKEPLREVTYETEQIDMCPKCKGVWCDGDELGCIIEDRGKTFTNKDQPEIVAKESNTKVSKKKELIPVGPCVYCLQPMNKINYGYSSGIIIERCKHKHGIWLDAGELEAVQIFAERWEKQQTQVESRYAGVLKSAQVEIDSRYEKMLQERKVSRFSSVNRFFRWISR